MAHVRQIAPTNLYYEGEIEKRKKKKEEKKLFPGVFQLWTRASTTSFFLLQECHGKKRCNYVGSI